MHNQPFRVLIVEDYKEERETFKDILSALHCVFSEAENYEQAYEKIKTQEFDVVILDIGLPGKTGLQLIRQAMREELPLAPVIVITGEAKAVFETEAQELGVFRYFLKDKLDNRELREAVVAARVAGRKLDA